MKDKLVISWLYSDVMNTYGDTGNVLTLKKRLEWRGIKVEVVGCHLGDKLDKNTDILFMGGAQDRDQRVVSADMKKYNFSAISDYVNSQKVSLFICAAFQLLGQEYVDQDGVKIMGAGLLPVKTIHPGRDKARFVGDVILTSKLFDKSKYIVGFENHGGRSILLDKDTNEFGSVIVGSGNNGEDKTEGLLFKKTICTYLHGPLLPKNPHVADKILELALDNAEYSGELQPLEDFLEWSAHESILSKYNIKF